MSWVPALINKAHLKPEQMDKTTYKEMELKFIYQTHLQGNNRDHGSAPATSIQNMEIIKKFVEKHRRTALNQ